MVGTAAEGMVVGGGGERQMEFGGALAEEGGGVEVGTGVFADFGGGSRGGSKYRGLSAAAFGLRSR